LHQRTETLNSLTLKIKTYNVMKCLGYNLTKFEGPPAGTTH